LGIIRCAKVNAGRSYYGGLNAGIDGVTIDANNVWRKVEAEK
jgi:hydroxymethylglutaryl-CoA reductase